MGHCKRQKLNIELLKKQNPKTRAANRLKKKGWSNEAVNKYLAETPLETMNRHNRENPTPD